MRLDDYSYPSLLDFSHCGSVTPRRRQRRQLRVLLEWIIIRQRRTAPRCSSSLSAIGRLSPSGDGATEDEFITNDCAEGLSCASLAAVEVRATKGFVVHQRPKPRADAMHWSQVRNEQSGTALVGESPPFAQSCMPAQKVRVEECDGLGALFDHLVGDGEQPGWNGQIKRLGGLEVDDEFERGRHQDGQTGRFLALEDSASVSADLAKAIG